MSPHIGTFSTRVEICCFFFFLVNFGKTLLPHHFLSISGSVTAHGRGGREGGGMGGAIVSTISKSWRDDFHYFYVLQRIKCYHAARPDTTKTLSPPPPCFFSFSPFNRTVLPLFFFSFLNPQPFLVTHTYTHTLLYTHTSWERESLGLCQILSTWLNIRKTTCITFLRIITFLPQAGEYGTYSQHHPPHYDTPLSQAQTNMTSFIFYDNKMVCRAWKAGRKALLAGQGTHTSFALFEKYSGCNVKPKSNNCAYLVILISSHGNEIRFRENISPEGAVREFENIVGPHNVKSRLIFVHRVKYGLQQTQSQQKKRKKKKD